MSREVEREELRDVVRDLRRAVQEMVWRHERRRDNGDSDDLQSSMVPRGPAPNAGSAAVAVEEPSIDDPTPGL